jgi:hypothetical protein
MLLPPPPTYCRTELDLFQTSLDYWRHRTSDVLSLQNIRIITRQCRMEHMHVRSMYQSRCKEAKESLCDSFTILLSFESRSVMGKISKWYVAQFVALTHHEWRHYQDAYNNSLLEAKLALTNKSLHNFLKMSFALSLAKMLCQSSIGYKAWLR